MAALHPEQINDLVNTTVKKFHKKSWTDASQSNQHHIFVHRTFKKKGTFPETDGSYKQNWVIQHANNDNMRDTGLYDKDRSNVDNITITAEVDWSMQTVNYSYDRKEKVFQGSLNEIVNFIKLKEHDMFTQYYEGMEQRLWKSPVSSDESPRSPYGIPYWVVKNATTGHTGLAPTGHTLVANVNPSTYAAHRNYAGLYTKINRTDLVQKVLDAMAKCAFIAPHDFAELGGKKHDWIGYTTYSVYTQMKFMQEQRNDNLGPDVGYYGGADGKKTLVIGGVPVEWVPALSNAESAAYDTTNPFYGINWRTFGYKYNAGNEMLRHKPKQAANQHDVYEVHMDASGQFYCYNRRDQFVLATAV